MFTGCFSVTDEAGELGVFDDVLCVAVPPGERAGVTEFAGSSDFLCVSTPEALLHRAKRGCTRKPNRKVSQLDQSQDLFR